MTLEEKLADYGFDNQTIIALQKCHLENLNILNSLKSLGYSKENIIKLISKYPKIVNYNLDVFKTKIHFFEALDLSKREVQNLVISKPNILTHSMDALKNKTDLFQKYGFTKQEIGQIVMKMPSVLSFSKEKLNKKLEILTKMDIKEVLMHNPKLVFIQSETLTLARFNFLKSIDFPLNNKSVRYLFAENHKFTIKFKITKEELLKDYQ